MIDNNIDMDRPEYKRRIEWLENENRRLVEENCKLRKNFMKIASSRNKQREEYEAKIAELQKCRDSIIDRFEKVADSIVWDHDCYVENKSAESLYCDLNTFECRALVSMIHDTGKVDNDELEMIEKKYHNDGGLCSMLEYFDFLMDNGVIEPAGEDTYILTEFGEELYGEYANDEFTADSTILYKMIGAVE